MKKKKKLVLGFAILIVAIFTLAGCDLFPTVEFPQEFWGTWKRDGINNTLTISATTYNLSHQSGHWILVSISGNTYTIRHSDGGDYRGTETIRLVNGRLEINSCNGTGLDNCGGTWIRQ